MRSASTESTNSKKLAAVYLDYENLYQTLEERIQEEAAPSEYINEVISELRRYLLDADLTRIANCIAYADFSAFGDERSEIERELFSRGTQPRYIPSHIHENASELQLCIDALDVYHRRPEIETFVFISGDREYYPLVHRLTSYGCNVIVVALDPPAPGDSPLKAEGDVFLDMMNLFGEDERRVLLRNRQHDRRRYLQSETTFSRLENAISYQTLEIAEEYFGQYDEIYLTPLLRKLSEVLGSKYDPKSIISDLEDAGAVRLEKRDGYPYNYTVLIINENHPDVQEIHERYYSDYEEHSFAGSTDGRGEYYDSYLEESASADEEEGDFSPSLDGVARDGQMEESDEMRPGADEDGGPQDDVHTWKEENAT